MPEFGTAVHFPVVSYRTEDCPVSMQELADGMDMQDDPNVAAEDGSADKTAEPDPEVSVPAAKT